MSEPTTQTGAAGYVPALRFRSLTRFYDPLVRLTVRDSEFKRRLLVAAQLRTGQDVLDLGCGTGTLAIMAAQAEPGLNVVGLDGDQEILERARAKAIAAGAAIDFQEGLSTRLPFAAASFDRVLSTLFFHHLTTADKRVTLTEVTRVLRPGGELHVADWGRPQDPLMAGLFAGVRALDGFERTRANVRGQLPELFEEAGLLEARAHDRLRTAFGSVELYTARRSP